MKKLLVLLIMLSTSVTANDLVITTGSEGGGYERLGKQIANSINKQTETKRAKKHEIEFDIEVVNSTGSGQNIEALDSGDAQIALVQADALNVHRPSIQFKAKKAGAEIVWWIYNTKNGFKDLEDIEGDKKSQMVLIEGSGAVYTMQSFVAEDGGYKVNYENAIYAYDIYDAFEMVCEGRSGDRKVSGLLYVGGSIPAEVKQDFNNCVSVGEATDGDFNDAKDVNGDKLYENCEIKSALYRPLKGASAFSEDTVCVNAMIVYTKEFSKQELRVIGKVITKTLKSVN